MFCEDFVLRETCFHHERKEISPLCLFRACTALLARFDVLESLLRGFAEHAMQLRVRSDEAPVRLHRQPPQRDERVDKGDQLAYSRLCEDGVVALLEVERRRGGG
jgi:hypothetical protein